MIYLDANFFIFAALDNTRKGGQARKLYDEIRLGKKAMTSALAVDEVMWTLVRQRKSHLLSQIIPAMYVMPNLEVREVPATTPLIALHFIEEFSLEPRDAQHLAIMEQFKIQQIASDDRIFDRIPHLKRIGFG